MLLGVKLTSKDWWSAAAVRAIKTIAQTAIATIGTSFVLEDVNWVTVCSASLLAGILSMLTSLAGLPELQLEEIETTSNEEALIEDADDEEESLEETSESKDDPTEEEPEE